MVFKAPYIKNKHSDTPRFCFFGKIQKITRSSCWRQLGGKSSNYSHLKACQILQKTTERHTVSLFWFSNTGVAIRKNKNRIYKLSTDLSLTAACHSEKEKHHGVSRLG